MKFNLENVKTIANIFGIVAIPIVTLVIGNQYTKAIKEREIQGKFVELAVGILSEKPTEENKNIRNWSIDVINQYSGVNFDKETREDLIDKIKLTENLDLNLEVPLSQFIAPEKDDNELRIDNNFLLGKGVEYKITRKSRKYLHPENLEGLVFHYTATGNIDSTANFLAKQSTRASAHILIGREGEVVQITPFNVVSWHAGVSSYKNLQKLNNHTISIELINWGEVKKVGNSFKSYNGEIIDPSEVQQAKHEYDNQIKYWHKYTKKQLDKTKEIARILVDSYDLSFIVGHSEISNRRKRDPGPLFPLNEYRKELLNN